MAKGVGELGGVPRVLGGFFFLTVYRKMGNEREMGNVFIFL